MSGKIKLEEQEKPRTPVFNDGWPALPGKTKNAGGNEVLASEPVSRADYHTGETGKRASLANGDDISESNYSKDEFESSWAASNFDAASASYKSGYDYGSSLRQRTSTVVSNQPRTKEEDEVDLLI